VITYHSEDGRIQFLPGEGATFSPDGDWGRFDDDSIGTSGFLRPVDEADAPKGSGLYVSLPYSLSPGSRYARSSARQRSRCTG
jgi:hypothetical protein